MPPKLSLKVDVSRDEPDDSSPQASGVGDSLYVAPTGTIEVKAYSFSSGGMSQKGGAHYKISDSHIKILKALGHGASSTVHKGFLFRENKFVAVKRINVFEKDTRKQMMNDLKALVDAPHLPGLINFFGAYHVPDSGQISIVLEYMDGGSLADVLRKVGRIPEDVLSKITSKVLSGLSYLHKAKHMVHRDIKPANILMNLEGECKITDFGISAFIDSTLAVCHTFLGTVTYMSPERINNQPYSTPADIWSLGLALVECATGTYPYDATVGPLQLMIHVVEDEVPIPPPQQYSEEFRDFVRLCMSKDPYQRPTADQLMHHPFIARHVNSGVALKEFMYRCAFEPHDKLDEIAIVFAWNFYALMSSDRSRELKPLYSEMSCYSYEGETAKGPNAIMERLKAVNQMYTGFGGARYHVDTVDCQPLGLDGSALVHVIGRVTLGAVSVPPSSFSETFILTQSKPSEYYVAHQIFRLLK